MTYAALTSEEIRAAFARPIEPIPGTHGYRIRMFALLLGVVLLQALYLLLVAAVAALTWLYIVATLGSGVTVNFFSQIHRIQPDSAMMVFYFGPATVGIIATLLLLKPIIMRLSRLVEPLQLTPEDEPV